MNTVGKAIQSENRSITSGMQTPLALLTSALFLLTLIVDESACVIGLHTGTYVR